MKSQFLNNWEEWRESNTEDKRESKRLEMERLLSLYVRENYPDLDDNKTIIEIKRDFQSDLPPSIVSSALDVEIDLAKRYRFTKNRGIIDTRGGHRMPVSNGLRRKVMKRDNMKCVNCEETENLTLHHIIPVKQGGQAVEENLAMLCEQHHLEAHCGDYTTGRVAYDGIDEFWYEFATP